MEKKPVDRADSLSAESDFSKDRATTPSHEDIATLAYMLWEERGSSDGGADQDWFEAEQQLREPLRKAKSA